MNSLKVIADQFGMSPDLEWVEPSDVEALCEAIDQNDVSRFRHLCGGMMTETLEHCMNAACFVKNPVFVEILLDNGVDPNANDGDHFLIASESGNLKTMRLLKSRGARLQHRFFDGACYWGENEAAYWLYLNGMEGYETAEFEKYKAQQNAKRNEAARKIYFWVLPKLYRNKEFVMQQADRSYTELFA